MDGEVDAERKETAAERQVRRDGEREFEKRIGFGPGGGGDVRGELGEPRGVVRREFESVEERRRLEESSHRPTEKSVFFAPPRVLLYI